MRKSGLHTFILLAAAVSASSALASPLAPSISATINDGTLTPIVFGAPTQGSNGLWTFSATNIVLPGGTVVDYWDITCQEDPILSSAIAFTNNDFVNPVHLIVSATMLTSIPTNTLIGSSIGGSLTDGDFSGAASLTHPFTTHLYSASIDGTPLINLLAGTASVSTSGDSTIIGPESAGLPGPTNPGPVVNTNISIGYDFVLSAGDQASFTSAYNVVAVPEPTTLSILGVVAGASQLRRRRRI